jgi:hypothetical protein
MKLSTIARTGAMTELIAVASKSFAGRCLVDDNVLLAADNHVAIDVSAVAAD